MKNILLITIIALLSGCSNKYLDETNEVDETSAYQLTDRKVFEAIDVAGLLNKYAPNSYKKDNSQYLLTESSKIIRLENALDYYNKQMQSDEYTSAQKTLSRNALQERILTASTQRCNAFKGNLQRMYSRTNFGLGLATTIAGTAGAIVNPVVAGYWSGASAIFSGARSEFNQGMMSNLAAYVIIDGIDKRRGEVYSQIQKNGQSKHYEDYPVEAAIKDALYFHGLCSITAGFQEASDSIKYSKDPGISSAIDILTKIKYAQQISNVPNNDLSRLNEVVKSNSTLNKPTFLLAGSALDTQPFRTLTNNDYYSNAGQIIEMFSEIDLSLLRDYYSEFTTFRKNRVSQSENDKILTDAGKLFYKVQDPYSVEDPYSINTLTTKIKVHQNFIDLYENSISNQITSCIDSVENISKTEGRLLMTIATDTTLKSDGKHLLRERLKSIQNNKREVYRLTHLLISTYIAAIDEFNRRRIIIAHSLNLANSSWTTSLFKNILQLYDSPPKPNQVTFNSLKNHCSWFGELSTD